MIVIITIVDEMKTTITIDRGLPSPSTSSGGLTAGGLSGMSELLVPCTIDNIDR